MRRALAATVAGLAVAAGGSASGATPDTPTAWLVQTTARSFDATVTWKVDRPAEVRILFGPTGTPPAIWSLETSAPHAGRYRTTIGPLEPNTEYLARLVFHGSTAPGPAIVFRTGPYPTRPRSRATPTGLQVDGVPFLPRMVFRQCAWAYGASLAAGINTFMGTQCESPTEAMRQLAGHAFLIPALAGRPDGPAVIGWHQPDEADVSADRPEALELLPGSAQTGRTVFLTFSNHVWPGATQLANARTLYPGLAARAEMIGADIYPLQSFCRGDLFAAVYAAQLELRRIAPGKPTYQWIEADPMELCHGAHPPTPKLVRLETWLAIAGGARGIGWFPENWEPPIRTEITKLASELRALAPALLAPETPISVAASRPILTGARSFNGALYVVVASPGFTRTKATFTLPGLGGRTVRAWGESRALRAEGDTFTDRLRGLETRVYVVPPPGFR